MTVLPRALPSLLVLALAVPLLADPPAADPPARAPSEFAEWETAANEWFGLGRRLEEDLGIHVALGVTQVYQANTRGALSTDSHHDRYSGSVDIEGEFDLETLLGLPGGSVYLLVEASWNDGIDGRSIGSVFAAPNADAAGDACLNVAELWYQQELLGGRGRLRAGKLDLTNGFEVRGVPSAFDGSRFANDEVTQFLNAALVNNPTIPFPDYGLGVMVHVEPVDGWYLAAALADADAHPRTTGFDNAFHGTDHFFSIYETGVVPAFDSPNGTLQGAYRAGVWYDPQPKERWNGSTKRDDVGFYASLDQMVWRERCAAVVEEPAAAGVAEAPEGDDASPQGIGVFARYGWADPDVSPLQCFWSVGANWQGPLPGRDGDVLAVGVAQGRLVEAGGFTDEHETVLELYYRILVTPFLEVTPDVQYILNPGGTGEDDAIVVGLRVQVTF